MPGLSQFQSPSQGRILIAVVALVISAAAGGALGEEPKAPSPSGGGDKTAQIEKGRLLFISYGCGWCHEGGGRKAARCPQLMDDAKDDDFLLTRIATGSPGRMPAFGQSLAEPEIEAIIVYIRDLKPQ